MCGNAQCKSSTPQDSRTYSAYLLQPILTMFLAPSPGANQSAMSLSRLNATVRGSLTCAAAARFAVSGACSAASALKPRKSLVARSSAASSALVLSVSDAAASALRLHVKLPDLTNPAMIARAAASSAGASMSGKSAVRSPLKLALALAHGAESCHEWHHV